MAASRELAGLIRQLPAICTQSTTPDLTFNIERLADEVSRTPFLAPDGFHTNPIEFSVLGLSKPSGLWKPISSADRILAIAPFATVGALERIAIADSKQKTLIMQSV